MEEVFECVRSSDKQRYALLYLPLSKKEEKIDDGEAPSAKEAQAVDKGGKVNATEMALDAFSPGSSGSPDSPTTRDTDQTHFFIRATQGHSIQSITADELLTPITLEGSLSIPDTVVHGTFYAAWETMLKDECLKKMARNHVHFSTGPKLEEVLKAEGQDVGAVDGSGKGRLSKLMQEGKVVSGMRRDAEVLIYLDIRKAMREEDGMKWWRSENGVVLSEGTGKEGRVESTWWTKVVEVRHGLGVLWEDGRLVKELPAELKSRTGPAGKRGGGAQRGGRGSRKPKLRVEQHDLGE